MHLGKMIICCLGTMIIFGSSQLNAGTLRAEGSASINLSNDNWTIDKSSMNVTNAKNCTPEVKYEHAGTYKTIGSCTYKGSDEDVRGDFYYDFEANVLFRDNSSKGFSLKAKGAKCHYQLQTMGPPTYNKYYYVDCQLKDEDASIKPFGDDACSIECSVEVKAGQGGVELDPTCK